MQIEIFNEIDKDLKKKIYYGFLCLVSVIAIVSFVRLFFYKNDINTMTLKGEKTLGHYVINKMYGPTPFSVNLTEVETGTEYKNVFISETCPKFNNGDVGRKFPLFKYTLIKASTGEKTFVYEGLYEAICTNVKKEIQDN